MGRQTGRIGRSAERRRKYAVRRVMVSLLLLVIVGGLTWLLITLINGKKPGTSTASLPETEETEPLPTPTPAPTPVPDLSESVDVAQMAQSELEAMGFDSDVYLRRDEAGDYSRADAIEFPRYDEYTLLRGITTFAGNNYRNTFTFGTQTLESKTLTRAWDKSIGSLDLGEDGIWSGSGWTGMPLIIEWDATVRATLGVYDEFKEKEGFTEVIYPAMDGKIYFMELSTGKATRDSITTGVVNKGTATLDPRGYPILYLGQGVRSTSEEGTYGAWFRVVSLTTNEVIWSFGGRDTIAYREWQSYDSSALISTSADTLVVGGENGLVYSVKLNTSYDAATGTLSVAPETLTKYRYTASGYGDSDSARWYGIEGSLAGWRNYAIFGDNGGTLQCVDLNTLTVRYAIDVGDDTDASVVIEEAPENDTFYCYTASKVTSRTADSSNFGKSYIRKLDGLTGRVVWEAAYDCDAGNRNAAGGTYATPHAGLENISDLLICAVSLTPVVTPDGTSVNGGKLVALDKATGKEVWCYTSTAGYWSSPAVVYDKNGDAYIIACDLDGKMKLHDARTGALLYETDLGSRTEATPAVFNNMLVVATRGVDGSGEGAKIVGIRLG